MLLRFCLLVAVIFISSEQSRISRRSAAWWHPGPEHEKDKSAHDVDWSQWNSGYGAGHVDSAHGHHEKDKAGHKHGAHEEAEQHEKDAWASAGKHAAAKAKKGSSKHESEAGELGKEIDGKTFGFFNYHYQQPQYHIEKFYTDEKQAKKFAADQEHRAHKDHAQDGHEASGWGAHGKHHHQDSYGHEADEHALKDHSDWGNDFHKGYDHSADKDYTKGHGKHYGDHHHRFEPEHHPHHHYLWGAPEEHHHGYESNWWPSAPTYHHGPWGNW